jgi:hypothetical protein
MNGSAATGARAAVRGVTAQGGDDMAIDFTLTPDQQVLQESARDYSGPSSARPTRSPTRSAGSM